MYRHRPLQSSPERASAAYGLRSRKGRDHSYGSPGTGHVPRMASGGPAGTADQVERAAVLARFLGAARARGRARACILDGGGRKEREVGLLGWRVGGWAECVGKGRPACSRRVTSCVRGYDPHRSRVLGDRAAGRGASGGLGRHTKAGTARPSLGLRVH